MSSMLELEGSLWLVWVHMRERCRDKNNPAYHRYGGRGIEVEEPWLTDRRSFYTWAHENGYVKGLHLDRIDNNGNYSPSNCRWVTAAENSRNKESNVNIEIDGEVKCKQDWMADPRVTIGYGTYYKRIAKGWPPEKALMTPPDPRYSRKKA